MVSVPLVVVAALLWWAAMPLWLVLLPLVDVVRHRPRWPITRLGAFGAHFLLVEVLGLLMLLGVWCSAPLSLERRRRRTWSVQNRYTAWHMRGVQRCFALRFVEQRPLPRIDGPVVVLVRHASIIDVLVPGVFLAVNHALKLRYVLKKELLWEPCLDIAGHWLPNHFVDRAGTDTEREVNAIRALKSGLSSGEGVLIYPEGTRFSRRKREAVLEKLTGLARVTAESLRHVLPVRTGGPLALLDTAPACDVIIVGHVGLEGFTTLRELTSGGLVGQTVQVQMWRLSAASIPPSTHERRAWLEAQWQQLDDWLHTREVEAQ